MIRETHQFTTREHWLALRQADLTSTSIAALLGRSPYMTPFELWWWKHRDVAPAFAPSEPMKWGNAFEESIARELAHRHSWQIRPMKEYMRLPEYRLGSSFDYLITNQDEPTILEIKNVGIRQLRDEGWFESDFGYEAPSYIEYQVQTQLLVSGLGKCIIGACIGGNEERLIERKLYEDNAEEIIAEAAKFWSSTEPPPADYYRDGDIIARLNAYAEPDKVVQADERMLALMREYHEFSNESKTADEEAKARKAELLTLIGDAEKVTSDEFSLSAGMIAPTEVKAYTRAGYRGWRLTKRKQK